VSRADIDQVLNAIVSESSDNRWEAAHLLGSMGLPALPVVPQLFEALQSPQIEVSLAACHALELLAAADAGILASALSTARDPLPHVRAHVWRLIDEGSNAQRDHELIVSQIIPLLLEAVHDPEAEVRHNAATVLATYLPPSSIPAWMELVADEVDLGWEAWSRIDSAFGHDALPFLAQAMIDSRPIVRSHAVSYIGSVRHPETIGLLLRALHDPDTDVRRGAVFSFRSFAFYPSLHIYTVLQQHPNVIPALKDAVRDPGPHVRLWAVDALLRLDAQLDEGLIDVIMALLNDEHNLPETKRTIGDRMQELLGLIATTAAQSVLQHWSASRNQRGS